MSYLRLRLLPFALALLALAGCDAPVDDAGAFSFGFSGARTARFDGAAEFVVGSCRSLSFRSGEATLSLQTGCPEPDYNDYFRPGTLRVAPERVDSAAFVFFYDGADRRAYHGTGGTVEITSESDARVTGRFDVEARRLRFDNQIDTTGTPLRIVGTFDARGFAGLD